MMQAAVTIVASPKTRDEILRSLRSTVEPTRVQPGCVDCRLYVDALDENLLTLIQQWKTKADLGRHFRSDIYPTLLAIMESSIEPPKVVFYTISKTEGLEAVERLRAGT